MTHSQLSRMLDILECRINPEFLAGLKGRDTRILNAGIDSCVKELRFALEQIQTIRIVSEESCSAS